MNNRTDPYPPLGQPPGQSLSQSLGHLCRSSPSRALAFLLALVVPVATGWTKEPGKTYCFHGICHRILTVEETEAAVGRIETVSASYYGDPVTDRANPSAYTSSGELFAPERDDNVASPQYPDGTKLIVFNPANGRAAFARVNNAGPYSRQHMLDVSRRLAERLGFLDKGSAKLHIKIVAAPSREEAKYLHGRSYPAMPGYLGTYASIDDVKTVKLERRITQASAIPNKPAVAVTQPKLVARDQPSPHVVASDAARKPWQTTVLAQPVTAARTGPPVPERARDTAPPSSIVATIKPAAEASDERRGGTDFTAPLAGAASLLAGIAAPEQPRQSFRYVPPVVFSGQ